MNHYVRLNEKKFKKVHEHGSVAAPNSAFVEKKGFFFSKTKRTVLVLHFLTCIFHSFSVKWKLTLHFASSWGKSNKLSFCFAGTQKTSSGAELLFPAVSDGSPVHIIHYFISSCVYIYILIFLNHYVQLNDNKVNHAQGSVAAWNSLFL